MSDSVSFDRAARYYDRTRVKDPQALSAAVDLLEGEMGGRGRVLEMGVGTGALALPLAERNIPLVGLDLSRSMMRELVAKADGRIPFPLVQADGTRAPFADGSFGGAYARWVLHLISNWRDAVAELCRVVRPRGRVVIEPGGYAGQWRSVWLRFVEIVGERAAPVGLDVRRGTADLDEAFVAWGAQPQELPAVAFQISSSLNGFFEEITDRHYSWTWRIPDNELLTAVEQVRDWASREYGDLDAPFDAEARMRWRAYDLP